MISFEKRQTKYSLLYSHSNTAFRNTRTLGKAKSEGRKTPIPGIKNEIKARGAMIQICRKTSSTGTEGTSVVRTWQEERRQRSATTTAPHPHTELMIRHALGMHNLKTLCFNFPICKMDVSSFLIEMVWSSTMWTSTYTLKQQPYGIAKAHRGIWQTTNTGY